MAEELPSYRTSFLSQLTLGASGAYATALLVIMLGVIFAKLPIETGEKLVAWATVPWSNILSAYLTARKTNNGTPANPPNPTP